MVTNINLVMTDVIIQEKHPKNRKRNVKYKVFTIMNIIKQNIE